MNMEDSLARRLSAVEDEPVLAVGVLCGEFGDVSVLRRLRYYQQVNRRLGRDVPKCDQAIILEHDLGRNLARDNELEDGWLGR